MFVHLSGDKQVVKVRLLSVAAQALMLSLSKYLSSDRQVLGEA